MYIESVLRMLMAWCFSTRASVAIMWINDMLCLQVIYGLIRYENGEIVINHKNNSNSTTCIIHIHNQSNIQLPKQLSTVYTQSYYEHETWKQNDFRISINKLHDSENSLSSMTFESMALILSTSYLSSTSVYSKLEITSVLFFLFLYLYLDTTIYLHSLTFLNTIMQLKSFLMEGKDPFLLHDQFSLLLAPKVTSNHDINMVLLEYSCLHQGPPLLAWIKFNLSMDK